MSSVVGICNSALIRIGESTITSLSDNSKAARLCSQMYEDQRDALLRAHPWNFAIKRAMLAQLTTSPPFGYGFEFQLPTDCLRVLETDYPLIDHKIEGRKLLSDAQSVKIKYISRVIDPNQFDDLFKEALSLKLAVELAYNLSDNNPLAQLAEEKYRQALKQAKSMDGQEGTPDTIEADDWLNSRI